MPEEANGLGEVRHARATGRRVVWRIAATLILAALGTLAARVVLAPLLRPAGWGAYHYLHLLVPLALAGAFGVTMLRGETRALVTRARGDPRLALAGALLLLLAVAAVLVSVGDLAFQLVGSGSAMQYRLAVDVIQWRAWLTTTALLFALLALVFALTSSAAAAVLLVAPVYGAMSVATLAKIQYMHAAVQPLDLLRLQELIPLFASFFGIVTLVAGLVALVLGHAAIHVAVGRWRSRMSARTRVTIALVALAPLAFILLMSLPASRLGPLANQRERLWMIGRTLGMPSGEHREMARNGGFVLNFLAELPTAFVETPRGYSAERAARTLGRYRATSASPARGGGINLVVYLVESLMDPGDLGVRFTADPMPNLRVLMREQIGGSGIVARSFGGSANGEFELLTGMSTSFLPEGALAYRQFVRHPIDALPRVLRRMGYASVAVQAGPRYYYDRERVYPLLGFERTVWLFDSAGVARADRGRWPSDDAIVDAVIHVSQERRPFFVFAFPAASHSPYTQGAYRVSTLDVLGAPTPSAAAEIKEYVNAVHAADRAVGRLIGHFRTRSDSTVVVVVGDHLPPLTTESVRLLGDRVAPLPPPERARALQRVPLLVWSNFGLPHGETTLSLNMLPPYLLERMGLPRTGLLAITDSLRHLAPVAGSIVQDTLGHVWLPEAVPDALRSVLDDYRLVQHHELIGR
jgi:hypothetical protein